jgi:hypothetical protein
MADAAPTVTIRNVGSAEIDDVAALLSARDGQTRSRGAVEAYLWGLDPACTRTWVAYVDGVPAGITMLYLRQMQWPLTNSSEAADSLAPKILAGYWSHLYVRPEFRSQMIYPQLVFAMLRGMTAAGISVIFTATRQPHVAEGHQKLGFALIGALPLKIKPLRPFRLLAKQKRIAALASVAAPLDAVFDWIAGPSRNSRIELEQVPLDGGDVDQIVALLNDPRRPPVRQEWTTEQFRRRFRATLDETAYRITAVGRNGRIVAALVTAIAERGNHIRAGILLEVAASAEATEAELRALVNDAHRNAVEQGCEVMLSMEQSLCRPQSLRPVASYLTNKTERYHLLVYPKKMGCRNSTADRQRPVLRHRGLVPHGRHRRGRGSRRLAWV